MTNNREVPDWISDVILAVAEIPDRNSPDDFPEGMIVTGKELRCIIENHMPAAPVVDDIERCAKAVEQLKSRYFDEYRVVVVDCIEAIRALSRQPAQADARIAQVLPMAEQPQTTLTVTQTDGTLDRRLANQYAEALRKIVNAGLAPEYALLWNVIRLLERVTDKAQADAEPVAIVEVGEHDHGPFNLRMTPHGVDTLGNGEHKLYAVQPTDALRSALEDAERYRWWKQKREVTLVTAIFGNGCINKTMDDVELYVDAHMVLEAARGGSE